MSTIERYKERYRKGETPWDIGRPDGNLVEMITRTPIPPCKALELGCGQGNGSVFLAQQGFTLTATDISEIAINKAREHAEEAGVNVDFLVLDFLAQDVSGAPFKFIYDRGCFHSFDEPKERYHFAKRAAAHLDTGGMWLSLIGSCDSPPREDGPPMRSLTEISTAIEPYFEFLSVHAASFASNRKVPPAAFICLMKKRG